MRKREKTKNFLMTILTYILIFLGVDLLWTMEPLGWLGAAVCFYFSYTLANEV